MTQEAKRKIHSFNFKGEGAHVALVDKAANLQEVLSMKASEGEVTVTMTMREFLMRFFHMWDEDAAVLAGILGYSTGVEQQVTDVNEFINGKIDAVSLVKSFDEIPEKLPQSIFNKVEELQKQFGDKLKETSEGSPLEGNIDIEKGESCVDKTEIENTELEELRKSAAEVESLKAQVAEMGTLKSLVDSLQAEKDAKAKDEMVEVVKGYSFVSEEDQEGLVAVLLKSEDKNVILATLEKARDAITAASAIDSESGAEGDGKLDLGEETSTEKSVDLTSEILKSRKA